MNRELDEEAGLFVGGLTKVTPVLQRSCPYSTPEPIPFIRIFLAKEVAESISAEGRKSGDREIGGVLVGLPFSDDGGPYLIIEGHIPATKAPSGPGHVTFTAETWTEVLRQQEERFPKSKIVGWYHTHPSLGVFMSGHDVFIHKCFFDTSWLVAYVTDPESEEDGFFAWDNEVLSPVGVHYVFEGEKTVRVVMFSGDANRNAKILSGDKGTEGLLIEVKSVQERLFDLASRLRRLEGLMMILIPISAVLLVLILVLLFDRYPIVKEIRDIVGIHLDGRPAKR
jgi:proteasome lid subunit RPN8/RPN11